MFSNESLLEVKKRKAGLVNPLDHEESPAVTSTEKLDSNIDSKRLKRQSSGTDESTEPQSPSYESCEEIVQSLVKLEPLPSKKPPTLKTLNKEEKIELEAVFGINDENPWRDDWAGNLAFADEDILNPDERGRKKQSFRQSLFMWALNNKSGKRLLHNLIRLVANMQSTPPEAKRILSFADASSVEAMEKAVRRTSFDPLVLAQDGWSTRKTEKHESASGGTNWIGQRVRWQNGDAIVLAYVYDADIGDMWKVAWIEEDELATFDLEAEELQEARRKWERRKLGSSKSSSDSSARKSSRFISSENFSVEGVEEGIVLASSFNKAARQGMFWPARIMHPSEHSGYASQHKRSSSKQKLEVIFLAPYWDSESPINGMRKMEGLSESGPASFQGNALFQIEAVDATYERIQPYPFDPDQTLDIDQVKNAFRFTGLPKSIFPRFLDSHRLALALKLYARTNVVSRADNNASMATAGLFETHPLSVRAPIFSPIALHLPYSFILSQLPHASTYSHEVSPCENILNLSRIVEAMKPPNSWGADKLKGASTPDRPISIAHSTTSTPSIKLFHNEAAPEDVLHAIVTGLPNLQKVLSGELDERFVNGFVRAVSDFVLALEEKSKDGENSKIFDPKQLVGQWTLLVQTGEGMLSLFEESKSKAMIHEWRIATERMYRRLVQCAGYKKQTLILTDWRCNGHVTNGTPFERSVRLPAALKGARLAGLGQSDLFELQESVTDEYIEYVESKLLYRAHEAKYLDKMKARCSSLPSDDTTAMLTEDSEGRGGMDTKGSRGTWKASVCAVAAAVTAVDKVVSGEFVNAFCATRPPGHHAGRKLHAMKAVSNGFCILNAAACAAIHAVTPIKQGGAGLDRVCVFDFDVHHGNGTQDILCSTYDPRFLYVSLHAGGSNVNGLPPENEMSALVPHANKSGGIFPGHCGDTSPHPNVLNLPLGARVTAPAVGSALLSKISPALERFSPNLIVLSAGFDAHKNDPMGLGLLGAIDFGHLTTVVLQLAQKICSGRVVSVLEGGYGVPCCRPQIPPPVVDPLCKEVPYRATDDKEAAAMPADSQGNNNPVVLPIPKQTAVEVVENNEPIQAQTYPSRPFALLEELPDSMDDQLPDKMPRRLEKCHQEGFIECVQAHVSALAKSNMRNSRNR
jgi:acetoin utilization deacetylase AcuC-like enzyme